MPHRGQPGPSLVATKYKLTNLLLVVASCVPALNQGLPVPHRASLKRYCITDVWSYDGTEVCELVGLLILNLLSKHLGKNNVGLYRDDGLAIVKGENGRLADIARNKLHAIFQQTGLKISAQVKHKKVNFLDVTFDLSKGKFTPFRKPNNQIFNRNTVKFCYSCTPNPKSTISRHNKQILST